MWVDVLNMKLLGKEKSFLNKQGERVASHMTDFVFRFPGSEVEQHAIGLCGTRACDLLHELRGDCTKVAQAWLRFDKSTSRNNKSYWYTTCYVEELKISLND